MTLKKDNAFDLGRRLSSPAAKAPITQAALKEQEEAISRLNDIIGGLEEQCRCVSNPPPGLESDKAEQEPAPVTIADCIYANTRRIAVQIARISGLRERLQI
jgi:hypothetical protein